jgi:hypothetical protein
MSDNGSDTEQQHQYYFSVGYHWSNTADFVSGMSHIKSGKPIITKAEALRLALRGTEHDPWLFNVTSFAPISKEQYDCFEEEEERNRKHDASSGCTAQ